MPAVMRLETDFLKVFLFRFFNKSTIKSEFSTAEYQGYIV